MKFGYIRVSTEEQNLDRQEALMVREGIEDRWVFRDKASGKDTNRPGFQDMMSVLREGDELYVESISRLARSTRDLLNIVEELNKRGVHLIVEKEKFDTSTPQGEFMLSIFAAMSQMERKTILQRQREGIEIAKAKGKYQGRKPIEVEPEKFEQLYRDWKNGKYYAREVMKELGMHKSAFYRKVERYEIEKGIRQSS